MGKRAPEGKCRICGSVGPLSWEHIPPQAAGNVHPVFIHQYDDVLRSHHGVPLPPPRKDQKGSGGYFTCRQCNSSLARYARAYGEFAKQAARVDPGGNFTRITFRIRPLAVLKQVVGFFACINPGGLIWPKIIDFVRNKEARALPAGYRFYAYRCWDARIRVFPQIARANAAAGGRVVMLSEVAMTPLGCLMTHGESTPHELLTEINDWVQFRPDQDVEMNFPLPCLPIVGDFPGDYRSKEEIERGAREQMRFMREKRERERPT